MPNFPSQDDIYRSWQQIAPRERESIQRYRASMLAVISIHKAQLVPAVAAYVTADNPDRDALVKAIDALLTAEDRQQVLAARAKRLAEQQAISEEGSAYLKQRYPELHDNSAPDSPPPGAASVRGHMTVGFSDESIGPEHAAQIVANCLFAPRIRPIENMTVAEMRTTTPLQMHGPGDETIRQQMRSAMLDALSAEHRAEAGSAIAEYTIAPDPDDAGLAEQLDATLTAGEQRQIVGAYNAFAAAQKAREDETRQRFERMMAQIPSDRRPPMMQLQMKIVEKAEDSDPGFLLPKALLTPPMTISIQRTP